MKVLIFIFIFFCQIEFILLLYPLEGQKQREVITNVINIYRGPKPSIPSIDPSNFKPKVSVVIPVYNEEKYIKNVVKSIQYQTLKEVEIVFIDDKSTDNSVKRILEFKKEDPRIVLIKNRINRGILYNRIYGALQSKGEYVAYLDADDIYYDKTLLEKGYKVCIKNDLDILEFDYYGGRYNPDTLDFKDVFAFTNQDKNIYNQVVYQPKIKQSFFYAMGTQDIIAGIVYNKFHSHNEIKKMANYIGEDFWNQHFIYMEDFIMSFAVARTADSHMLMPITGVFHWFENPDGMTRGVFDMDGDQLKYPDNSNKKLGDYLAMWEKAYDLTENEPDYEYFRLKLLFLLQSPDNRHVFARTYQYERILNLCRRMYNWKYASNFGKEFSKNFAIETIKFEVPMKEKYFEFFEDDKNQKGNKKKKDIKEKEYKENNIKEEFKKEKEKIKKEEKKKEEIKKEEIKKEEIKMEREEIKEEKEEKKKYNREDWRTINYKSQGGKKEEEKLGTKEYETENIREKKNDKDSWRTTDYEKIDKMEPKKEKKEKKVKKKKQQEYNDEEIDGYIEDLY